MSEFYSRAEIMQAADKMCDNIELIEKSFTDVMAENAALKAEVERLSVMVLARGEPDTWPACQLKLEQKATSWEEKYETLLDSITQTKKGGD